jgi:putative membrane protein
MDVRARVRDRPAAVAALGSLLALALVFGAVLGAVPGDALPRVPALLDAVPHLNAALSLGAIATVLAGVRAIRRGDVARHRALMLATTALFALFLVLYLYKVAVRGPAPFPGPEAAYRLLYLPVLTVHVVLAVVCVPLVAYALTLAFAHPVAELPATRHPTVGRAAATLWLVSFALGLAVYALLYLLY